MPSSVLGTWKLQVLVGAPGVARVVGYQVGLLFCFWVAASSTGTKPISRVVMPLAPGSDTAPPMVTGSEITVRVASLWLSVPLGPVPSTRRVPLDAVSADRLPTLSVARTETA